MRYLNYIVWLMLFAPGVQPQTWRQFYDWDKKPQNQRKLAEWGRK